MLYNYLKIALRSLGKNKAFSLINIIGLTLGLSCCLMIGLYIRHELSFDAFQEKGGRVARVLMEIGFEGEEKTQQINYTSTKVAPVFSRTFPEVEQAVRMTNAEIVVHAKGNVIKESSFMFADSSFFRIFHAKMISGNPQKALDGPDKVVLTRTTAERYFGNENPLGKILLVGTDTTAYQVTGVMEDYPANSQLKFDFLASFSSLGQNQEQTYFNANYITYLLLRNEASFEPLQAKIHPFMKKEMEGSGAKLTYILEHFDEVHLHSEFDSFVPNTDITYLYILGVVSLLILAIVCFTYINLSTARSMERAREVGVRKSVGARKSQLFGQFIGESAVTCLVAAVLSVGMAAILLPYFNTLADRHLALGAVFSMYTFCFLIVTVLLVSLLAGFYPALVLSGFQPVKVLKGSFQSTVSGRRMQQSLIVFQFGISVFLIVATFTIQNQIRFIQNKKLGFDREKVLALPINSRALGKLPLIKGELQSNPSIVSVSRCEHSPVSIMGGYNMRAATMPENAQMSVTANPVDEDYIKTSGMQLVAGEDLTRQDVENLKSKNESSRLYQFILNESAARALGWSPAEAVGKRMFLDNSRPGVVKGIIKDFHFESMHHAIKPLVLFPEEQGRQLLVKVAGNDFQETIAFLQAKWRQLLPDMPFEYRFLDEDYDRLYRSELQLGRLMGVFTGLSIVLACMGLFGLASYIVQQRMKEISIRKVLGSSVSGIVMLIASGFVRLVAVSLLLALPLGWWAMDKWLGEFSYRTNVSWLLFAVTGLCIIGVTLLTTGFEAFKAALKNPVKALSRGV